MCKVKTVQNRGKYLDWSARELMIKEYLSLGENKQIIWENILAKKKNRINY